MITGEIAHIDRLFPLGGRIEQAARWIADNADRLSALAPGTATVIAPGVIVKSESVELRAHEQEKPEGHARHIDIHVPLDAVETIGWAPLSRMESSRLSYDPEADLGFFGVATGCYVRVSPGEFMLLWPEDVHAPCMGEGSLRKLCVKIEC